jgi:hypothetical protein
LPLYEVYIGNRGKAPLVLNLGIRWEVTGQIQAPVALPTG